MKCISIRLKPMMKTPAKTIHLGPYLSVTQPVSGASIPPSNLPILAATDVVALLKPSSEDMGLNSAENP